MTYRQFSHSYKMNLYKQFSRTVLCTNKGQTKFMDIFCDIPDLPFMLAMQLSLQWKELKLSKLSSQSLSEPASLLQTKHPMLETAPGMENCQSQGGTGKTSFHSPWIGRGRRGSLVHEIPFCVSQDLIVGSSLLNTILSQRVELEVCFDKSTFNPEFIYLLCIVPLELCCGSGLCRFYCL